MNIEKLHKACAMANLEWEPDSEYSPGCWVLYWEENGEPCAWSWYEDDPALPDFVAKRLAMSIFDNYKLTVLYVNKLCRNETGDITLESLQQSHFRTAEEQIDAFIEIMEKENDV